MKTPVTQTLVCSVCLLLATAAAQATERAAYDVGGRITALLSNSEDVEIATNVVAVLPNAKRVRLQTRREEARRQGNALAWSLDFELPDGGQGTLTLKSEEDATGLHYTTAIAAESTLEFIVHPNYADQAAPLLRGLLESGKPTVCYAAEGDATKRALLASLGFQRQPGEAALSVIAFRR